MAQKSDHMGMHTEQLAGRTQQRFFSPEENESFVYPGAFDVDFNKRAEFDAGSLDSKEINLKLRELMSQGYGTIVMKNPGAKHALGVGILCEDHSMCQIEHNVIGGTRVDGNQDLARQGIAIEAQYFAAAQLKNNTVLASPGGIRAFSNSTISR